MTYYNLVTTFVARREELVLQRMRTGELTDAEVLLGTAVPTLLVTVVQLVLVAVGVVVLGEWSAPVDVVLPLVALLGGGALMVAAGRGQHVLHPHRGGRAVHHPAPGPGGDAALRTAVPAVRFPEQLAEVARFLPLTPVIELGRLGLVGADLGRAGGRHRPAPGPPSPLPLAVLAGWLVVGAVLARLVFRWAPRR